MAFSGDGLIPIDKLGGNNFNIYKFKLEMVFSTKDLWEILEGLARGGYFPFFNNLRAVDYKVHLNNLK